VLRGLGALAKEHDESINLVRAAEVARCDQILGTLTPLAVNGDYQATDRVARVMCRKAKLLGLNRQPEKLDKRGRGSQRQSRKRLEHLNQALRASKWVS
jgi:hypothetical protein